MSRFHLLIILIFISLNVFGGSKIYLIRHAAVEINKPGWVNAKKAHIYKEEYNHSDIQIFDPEMVLNKIENYKEIDTVFCSPQMRAIQTAEILFQNQANLKIDKHLMELDYPVSKLRLIKLPINVWLTMSRISWMIGNRVSKKPSYNDRKENLEIFVEEIIDYAEKNGKSVVVAHGMVNRELIRILKKKGWNYELKEGLGNLSVNCLVK